MGDASMPGMAEPIVREFAESDLDAVVGLSLRAWAPVFASMRAVLEHSGVWPHLKPGGWRDCQRRDVETVCRSADTRVWVAEVAGVVAGFVAVRIDTDAGIGEITMIAVDPGHQRRGIGLLLTRHAAEAIRAAGVPVAMVETGGDPGHAPARRLYERAGFTPMPIARYFMKP